MYRYGLGEARAADTDWIGVWCTAAVKHRGNGIELWIGNLLSGRFLIKDFISLISMGIGISRLS